MKIRDIGEKIGDIEIKKPSSASLSKFGILISILYRIIYWGLLIGSVAGTVSEIVKEATGKYGSPLEPIVFGLAVIAGDLLLMFIIKQYKKQTQDL